MKMRFLGPILAMVGALIVVAPAPAIAASENKLTVTSSTPYTEGDSITLRVDFKVNKKWKVSLWSDVSGSWAKVSGFSGKTTSSKGVYDFKNYVVNQDQNVEVRIDSGSTATTDPLALDPLALNVGDPASPDSTLTDPAAGSYTFSDSLSLVADFPSGTKKVTLWQRFAGETTWTPVGSKNQSSNSSGNKTFNYTVVGNVDLQARTSTGLLTNLVTLTPVPATLTNLTFDNPSSYSSTTTATVKFEPVRANRTIELHVQRRYTAETNEQDAINPEASKGNRVGPWEKVATAKTNSSGIATFKFSTLEAEHKYRAAVGTLYSNEATFKPVMPAKSTGLAQVYYNTYENDSVNTRTRYFEGEFSMKAATSGASGVGTCGNVNPIKYSTMKGRGNYSWSFKKKGYTLKIDKATDLCGMGKNKKWALIANHYDKSLIRNMVALNLGANAFTNIPWTPEAVPVDFFMNGEYKGTYMLVERISISGSKTGSNSDRINIDELKGDVIPDAFQDQWMTDHGGAEYDNENQATDLTHPNNLDPYITGGYVMEWDFRKGGDKNISVGSRGYVGLKDPEYDVDREGNRTNLGVSAKQVDYINDYLDEADAAVCGSSGDWRDYIDSKSAVDYYLAMEMLKPIDGNMWASVYMYKPRYVAGGSNPEDDGKIRFGPLWDFDLGLGSANRQGNAVSPTGWYLRDMVAPGAAQSSKTWFTCLNDKSNFRSMVSARWNNIYNDTSSTTYINGLKDLMAASATQNFKTWKYSERISKVQVFKGSWSKDVDYVKGWMSSRRSWMNAQY